MVAPRHRRTAAQEEDLLGTGEELGSGGIEGIGCADNATWTVDICTTPVGIECVRRCGDCLQDLSTHDADGQPYDVNQGDRGRTG